MTVATKDNVAVAIGRPISDQAEVLQVEYWLRAVELQIKSRLGELYLLDQETLRFVEIEAVAARMLNPGGLQSETIDDYTYRYGSETRQVGIRDEWWEMLRPTERRRRRAFSVMPS